MCPVFLSLPIFESWLCVPVRGRNKTVSSNVQETNERVYREKHAMSNAWTAGAKELEYIENGKSNFFFFHAAFCV